MNKKYEKAISLSLIEEAARDFNVAVERAAAKIDVSLPNMIFQEKHTSGWLWYKRTWYTYYKYSEGNMIGIPIYPNDTIRSIERSK